MKKVQLICDGSAIGNPGARGMGFDPAVRRSGALVGSEPRTTNNRCELRAAIEGLRALREPCDIIAMTDSQYVKQGITEHIARWKQNGWRTASHKPVLNQDLWQELDSLASLHTIRWVWVAGHGDHAIQNRCDAMARAAARAEAAKVGGGS